MCELQVNGRDSGGKGKEETQTTGLTVATINQVFMNYTVVYVSASSELHDKQSVSASTIFATSAAKSDRTE